MKKYYYIICMMLFACFLFGTSVSGSEDTVKIAMNGTVKQAKDIGSGKGIGFILQEPEDKNFYLTAVELAVFEQRENETDYRMYLDENGRESKKIMLNSPKSLHVQAEFGAVSDYQNHARYKLGYRYYLRHTEDASQTVIAGSDIKDGWRLIGENDNTAAGKEGFTFYRNSAPEISIAGIAYQKDSPSGEQVIQKSVEELSEVYLPMNVWEKGLTVYSHASDYDSEDILTGQFILRDAATQKTLLSGSMPSDLTIRASNIDAEEMELKLIASDQFGGSGETDWIRLHIDRHLPRVIREYDDGGFAVKGDMLFSEFTIEDDPGVLMADGLVHAIVAKQGETGGQEVRLTQRNPGVYRLQQMNMPDGAYVVSLLIYDRAGNRTNHTFLQTLDHTAPTVVLPNGETNPEATDYETWMRRCKKVILEAEDVPGGIAEYSMTIDGAGTQGETFRQKQSRIQKSWHIPPDSKGKITVSGFVSDAAKEINQAANAYKVGSKGNVRQFHASVWIDQTLPETSFAHVDDGWKEAPYSVTVSYRDAESRAGAGDVSGIAEKLYAVTDSPSADIRWQNYTEPIAFSEGGTYYLHTKAVDTAGNESIDCRRVRVNERAEFIREARPTEAYKHTIYYAEPAFYVVKNTAYSTQYEVTVLDHDISDTLLCRAKLVNRDDNTHTAYAETVSNPNESRERTITFWLSYLADDGTPLPDGVYDLNLTLIEEKADGEQVTTYRDHTSCCVVIKRNAPPKPIIRVSDGNVDIEYPSEILAGSLNVAQVAKHCKKQYKTVTEGYSGSNVYLDYIDRFPAAEMTVTALYTDIAGNASVSTKRIFGNGSHDENNVELQTEGHNTVLEEARNANVYYIGIRREKQCGINTSIFEFIG